MTQRRENGVLMFAGNGANRPLHQDRQVLRAEDLRLEQSTQDQMLARARRHLHGWGVVSGLVPEVENTSGLVVGAGYGVTPLGDELFLPEPVSLADVAQTVLEHCGEGIGCDIFETEIRAEVLERIRTQTVTSYLIAKPESREAEPRTGVPQDCAHPAARLLPSRRCGGVEFAIICSLPPSHEPAEANCSSLTSLICGTEGVLPPLPWEVPLGADANFLVLARLIVIRGQFGLVLGPARRRLLPVALMQDWITSCLCPVLDRQRPVPEPVEPIGPVDLVRPIDPIGPVGPLEPVRPVEPIGPIGPVVGPIPIPGGPIVFPVVDPREVINPDIAILHIVDTATGRAVALPAEVAVGIRDRFTGNVLGIGGIGPARANSLAAIEVTTEGDFLTAPTGRLASTLRVTEAKIIEMKNEVNLKRNLRLVFG